MTMTMGKRKVGTNLTEGPILKGLLTFAIPIVLANLLQQLYSMVDLMVIGKYVGSIGTVGVNTGGEMADLVTPVAMGFSTAGQIYIAQLFGARQEDRIKKTVGTLLTFMFGASVVLAIGVIAFHTQILHLLNCPAEAMGQASSYMIITALGFPFIFGYNAVCGVLRGMGESKRPLLFVSIAATVNIVLDLLLVAVIPLEAAGTAIATIASQFGSFAAAFYFMYKKKDQFDFELSLSYFKVDMDSLKVLVRLGVPQVVRSMFVRIGMLWVNSSVNSYGLVVSSTNSIGNKLQKFLEVFIQGIDTACASMIGQNLGARKTDRAKKTLYYTVASVLVCATFSALLCIFVPTQIFGLFTSDPEVLELGKTFLRIFIIHFYSSAITGSFQAMVTGSGFVELGFIIGVLDGLVCKIGFGMLFMSMFNPGYLGIWLGVSCSRIIPGMISIIYFFSGKWKTRKLLTEK